jgi:hypothetical protein
MALVVIVKRQRCSISPEVIAGLVGYACGAVPAEIQPDGREIPVRAVFGERP